MFPSLGEIGGFRIPTHDLFVFLGVAVALVLTVRHARRRHEPFDKLYWVIAAALFGGAIGARAALLVPYLERAATPSLIDFYLSGGRSVLGGLAGAYLAVVIVRRWIRYPTPTGDIFVPGVSLGMAIGRIGCLLTEQLGTETTLPWGVRLAPELAARVPNCPPCARGAAMHPSFLYEIILLLALSGLVMRWRTAPRVLGIALREGDRFRLFLVLYGIGRFGLEFVRGNAGRWHGLSGSQLFLLPSLALLVTWFVVREAQGPKPSRDGPGPASN